MLETILFSLDGENIRKMHAQIKSSSNIKIVKDIDSLRATLNVVSETESRSIVVDFSSINLLVAPFFELLEQQSIETIYLATYSNKTENFSFRPLYWGAENKIPFNFNLGKILIIEDDEISAEIQKNLVIQIASDVSIASNKSKAMEHIKKNHVDLIILDFNLGLERGDDISRSIKSVYKTMPIIGMSASVSVEDINSCLKSGMVDMLQKPLNKERLIELYNKGFKSYHQTLISFETLMSELDLSLSESELKQLLTTKIEASFLDTQSSESINTLRSCIHSLKGTFLYIKNYKISDYITELENDLDLANQSWVKNKFLALHQRLLDELKKV